MQKDPQSFSTMKFQNTQDKDNDDKNWFQNRANTFIGLAVYEQLF